MRQLPRLNPQDTLVTLIKSALQCPALFSPQRIPPVGKQYGKGVAFVMLVMLISLPMSARAGAMNDEVPAEQPAESAGTGKPMSDPSETSDPEASAEEAEPGMDAKPKTALGIPTLGGRQFWGDVRYFRGWKIQKNVLSGHYRLLDPQDRRYSWGKLKDCEQQLQKFRQEQDLKPMSGTAVLLLHGIGRSSHSFSGMTKALQQDGVLVVPFDYPSTRLTIQDSAEYLHEVIQSLEGVQHIHVVAHSMGGLLLRAYLMKYQEPRFGSAVMLGVPNRGAEIADVLKDNPLFKAILGPAGQQLVTSADCVLQTLPVPEFAFGVIAGGRSQPKGFNPLLPGDNDLTVTVASTRLPGAADFRIVPVMHSFLMNDKAVIQFTRNFLQHGRFDPAEPLQPITADSVQVLE